MEPPDALRLAADLIAPPLRRSLWRFGDPNDPLRINRPGRPEQLHPLGDWLLWLILAGRGFGKTRTGAEDTVEQLAEHAGWRWAVVAPTFGDARDVCIEGESGVLAVLNRERITHRWNRSMGQLVLDNGSRIQCFSADEPDRLRGPQHHGAWCDELAAWRYPDAWDQLQFGLRLGEHPRTVVTTTPRPTALVKDLLTRATTHITRGSTLDNAKNLAPAALEELRRRYEGTRLGRQELYAELLEDVEGALWTLTQLEADRVTKRPELQRIVVAIDPAASNTAQSDETGIIVAGLGMDGDGYVLEDCTLKGSPSEWAKRAVWAYYANEADRIIAERNQGGDMVEHTLRTVDQNVPITTVHATRGKILRAEPVAALYEQHRVHHVGVLADLETQMTQWDGAGDSPDRVDALVYALQHLMIDGGTPVVLGSW